MLFGAGCAANFLKLALFGLNRHGLAVAWAGAGGTVSDVCRCDRAISAQSSTRTAPGDAGYYKGPACQTDLFSDAAPLFLILIVLGSIFAGLATPTEAGAMGGFGALVLAAINRRLQLRTLTESLKSTIALSFGYDLVWFGVMLGVNLQTSFLTPPFGFSLFYLRGVSPPEVKTTDIYRGVVPFIAIQLVALLLLIRFPQLVTWVLA